jgi:hypothetical protein
VRLGHNLMRLGLNDSHENYHLTRVILEKISILLKPHERDQDPTLEINTLKCKVDKLNKDCAVLTKKYDQLCGLSNGLRDVLKKYITKEKKAIEVNMLWRSVADIVLKLMCVSCCYIYSRQIFHRNKE